MFVAPCVFLMSILADFYGRYFVLKLNYFLFIIGAFIIFFNNFSYNSVIFAFILFAIFYDVFYCISSIVLNESLGIRYWNLCIGIINVFYSCGNFTLLIINLYIKDYKNDIKLFCLLAFFSLLFMIFYETPFFYYKKKNIK